MLFKKYGIPKCFTIEVNASQASKTVHLPVKCQYDPAKNAGVNTKVIEAFEKFAMKPISDRIVLTKTMYHKIGKSFLRAIADYYELLGNSRIYGSPFLNHDNFKTSITLDLSLKFPFRFYPAIQAFHSKGKQSLVIRRNHAVGQRVHGEEKPGG